MLRSKKNLLKRSFAVIAMLAIGGLVTLGGASEAQARHGCGGYGYGGGYGGGGYGHHVSHYGGYGGGYGRSAVIVAPGYGYGGGYGYRGGYGVGYGSYYGGRGVSIGFGF
ncbi:hypothetical protein Pla108_11220 [Botrimarina colliarenosi]|uniref:Uncharacterized protein n=1 Tax=Botrimarina colliarenosi TaxID=2528001 RepID=A0A5C6AL43_9BACT|nr:hypothetical protein [Botrimarina colliarenosi]TWU00177.1 hypothetical protein Pla108_11220 [Botrimarina colliarenosi]